MLRKFLMVDLIILGSTIRYCHNSLPKNLRKANILHNKGKVCYQLSCVYGSYSASCESRGWTHREKIVA